MVSLSVILALVKYQNPQGVYQELRGQSQLGI